MRKTDYIYMDKEFVKWEDAKIHVLTHTLHYGNGVFEGTRAYKTDKGLAIFRLDDHIKRLYNSAKITMIKPNLTFDEIREAHIKILKMNNFTNLNSGDSVYIRPLIYLGYGVMGLYHVNAPVHTMIACWEWGNYLGDDGLEKGIRVKISSFTRNSVNATMGKAKAVANYLNSQMAKYEAIESGYEEGLLLDNEGFIAEGSGEILFIVRDNILICPPNDNSLESLTQNTIFKLAQDFNISIEKRRITRDEVYISDEAFFVGTAAEVTPIREVDGRIIGNGQRGQITEKLQSAYFDVVHGKNLKYKDMLTYIN